MNKKEPTFDLSRAKYIQHRIELVDVQRTYIIHRNEQNVESDFQKAIIVSKRKPFGIYKNREHCATNTHEQRRKIHGQKDNRIENQKIEE